MAKSKHRREDWFITKYYREIDGKAHNGTMDVKLMYPTGKAKAEIRVVVKLKGKVVSRFSRPYSSKAAATKSFYSYDDNIERLFAFINRNT